MTVIGVVAPGAMGSGVARRLREHGAEVLTLLEGRSSATQARAAQAGMTGTDVPGLLRADMILSIVPPAEALPLAERLAPAMGRLPRKPLYVDCNAVSIQTAEAVGAVISPTGARFVDGGIIGGPPVPGAAGPTFYVSGAEAGSAGAVLRQFGIAVEVLDGPVGAASALKMSYAGITKGLTAIASIMILGAERAGAGAALRTELAASQPQLLARFGKSIPDMVPKAYRWVAEMQEIAAFLGEDAAGAAVFESIAAVYDRIARDAGGPRREVGTLEAFVRPNQRPACPPPDSNRQALTDVGF